MTKHEIATLACRLLGIYAVLRGALTLKEIVIALALGQPLGAPSVKWAWIAVAGSLILFLAIGLLLWYLAERLATRMIFAVEHSTQQSGLAAEIQATAFSIVGLFVLVDASASSTSGFIAFRRSVWTGRIERWRHERIRDGYSRARARGRFGFWCQRSRGSLQISSVSGGEKSVTHFSPPHPC